VLKDSGNRAQRDYLDQMALSQIELRGISDSLLGSLSTIKANDVEGQLIAAVALIQMNVTPVSVINIPFGGDNHSDANLARETSQHVSGVASINSLMQKLAAAGLKDRTTLVMMNVFGRSLNRPLLMGRDHLGNHHCSIIVGNRIRGSVIGGVAKLGSDYTATGIDAATGASNPSGDVRFEDTLSAVGKTIGVAVGIPDDVLTDQITTSKPITAALNAA
jgi:hypothetical protein